MENILESIDHSIARFIVPNCFDHKHRYRCLRVLSDERFSAPPMPQFCYPRYIQAALRFLLTGRSGSQEPNSGTCFLHYCPGSIHPQSTCPHAVKPWGSGVCFSTHPGNRQESNILMQSDKTNPDDQTSFSERFSFLGYFHNSNCSIGIHMPLSLMSLSH